MMPELPEVETIVRDLTRCVKGRSVETVEILDDRVIRGEPAGRFVKKVRDNPILDVSRRGKAVIFTLKRRPQFFIVQLMMTGQLIYRRERAVDKATKLVFKLSNAGYLHYNDHRLFGRLQIVDDLNELAYFQTLGPEPLEETFSVDWLQQRLQHRPSPIKSLLMNSRFIAGIGNIYASEILFYAGIRPTRPAGSLKNDEVKTLHRMTIGVLAEAIKFRGTSMRNYRDMQGQEGNFRDRIQVYGREGQECSRCRTSLKKIVQSGRSSFFCPRCQK